MIRVAAMGGAIVCHADNTKTIANNLYCGFFTHRLRHYTCISDIEFIIV